MAGKISGIHHVTAIAGEPQRNLCFYTGILGLKLVKLTVNYDDPTTYHIPLLLRPGIVSWWKPLITPRIQSTCLGHWVHKKQRVG